MTENHGFPDDAGDGAVKGAQDARQGETTGHVRWILRISLVLGVLALGAVFVGYTASNHHAAPATPAAASASQNPTAG